MRILDISPKVVLPPTTGSRVRIWNLLRHLSASHEVRQFSQQRRWPGFTANAVEVSVTPSYSEIQYSHPVLSVIGNVGESTRIAAPPMRGIGLGIARPPALRSLLGWADVVIVEFPWQFPYVLRRRGGAPLVLAAHNVEAERFESVARAERGPGAEHRWAAWIERVERKAVLGAELVVAVSEDDREGLIRRYGVDGNRVVVVPNGAETTRYAPADATTRSEARRRLGLPQRPTVLYTGSNTAPNRAGLAWVRRLAERAPHLSFVVVGELSSGLEHERFATPGVVNDMTPFLQAADISICPIEFGGGTKIKLLEGLAAGLPTVAFAEATQGLAIRDGEHLRVVAKDETAIVAAIDELVKERDAARRIAERGRAYVCEHHDWARVAERLDALLTELVGRGASPPGAAAREVERAAGS
jgi:glycosyltransferase involved in cell wall biosynthesis